MLASLTVDQYAFLIASTVSAIAAAVVTVITAFKVSNVHNEVRPPSNGVTSGAVTENTAMALGLLTQLYAEQTGKQIRVPSPRETQALAPGSTLSDPPAVADVVTDPAPPAPPGQ